ncbi:MAG: SURF1 family protein [Cereibacter sphaeroides]|uniref:SURF1-like protein n=1 Tax=Cereibacter sphaeroides TaxID=1063 RepID=A0A2W5UR88_CERSP|nr:MAG: SURF1 family protein [Cereibacter sphaeroides]
MTRRMIIPLLFGLVGAAILIGLGVWQLQRLATKQAALTQIAVRLNDAPAALPAEPRAARDKYLTVRIKGRYLGPELDVLTSAKDIGPGYRVIAAFQLEDGRIIMVDRGFIPEALRDTPRNVVVADVVGALHWPDEADSYTPAPDTSRNIWFARDVPAMASALGAEPVLVVARVDTGDGITPLPVDTSSIPNNHRQYAITWFSLAVVWLGMTVLLLRRIRRRTI